MAIPVRCMVVVTSRCNQFGIPPNLCDSRRFNIKVADNGYVWCVLASNRKLSRVEPGLCEASRAGRDVSCQ